MLISFEDASGEFIVFKKVISGTMYEVAERLDDAAEVLGRLTGVVMGVNKETIGTIERGNKMLAGKQDVMLEKQDTTIAVIKNGVDEMREFRTETQQNFTNLDIYIIMGGKKKKGV